MKFIIKDFLRNMWFGFKSVCCSMAAILFLVFGEFIFKYFLTATGFNAIGTFLLAILCIVFAFSIVWMIGYMRNGAN